jgi:erythromycin esterase
MPLCALIVRVFKKNPPTIVLPGVDGTFGDSFVLWEEQKVECLYFIASAMTPVRFFAILFIFFIQWGCTPKADEVVVPGGLVTQGFQIPDAGIYPLENDRHLDVLLNEIGNASLVLLGEASHGTADFSIWRAAITRRLVEEKGFKLIAIEGDGPAAYAVNRYGKGDTRYASSRQALATFGRWPAWMWANEEMAAFTDWLRTYNGQQAADQQVSFYGLDVYSLWESLESLQKDFPEADPVTVAALNQALNCLGPYDRNTTAYAQASKAGGGCSEELNKLLAAVQNQVQALPALSENAFNAWQNAITALNAHHYYQAALVSNLQSWRIREHHMMETIDRLIKQAGPNAKIIVWAHNTHVGDARFSNMVEGGMENLGQLVREKYKAQGVYLAGFGTYEGSVVAATVWGGPLSRMTLPQAQPDSWEAVMHAHSPANKLVLLREWRKQSALTKPRGHRAIGVVYAPNQEAGTYVPSNLPNRYDAFLYLDKTQALRPLSDFAGTLRRSGPE